MLIIIFFHGTHTQVKISHFFITILPLFKKAYLIDIKFNLINKIVSKLKLLWLILVLMLLLIFNGCGNIEPGTQDTRTVILNMVFNVGHLARSSSSIFDLIYN